MSSTPGPRTQRFRIVPVGRGVWAAIGNRALGVPSNAGIVDLDSAVLIIDSFPTLQAAMELRMAARVLTGRDPSVLVNTHWHFDHWLGNVVFSDLDIFGTVATRDGILESGPAFLESLRGDPGEHASELIQARWEREERPWYKEELGVENVARQDLYEMYRALQLRAPNQTFATRFRLPATRSLWFVEVAGHTRSDTMVFVPDAEILFAGDIVSVGVHPSIASGRIDQWRDALAGVEKIAPGKVVPGHGSVCDLTACADMRDYLAAMERAIEGSDLSELPERFRTWLSPSIFDQNLRCLRSARTITD